MAGLFVVVLGVESSANKVGVGVVAFWHAGAAPPPPGLTLLPSGDGGSFAILANPRKTYLTRPGEGFLPRETAWHHQAHVAALVRLALAEAGAALGSGGGGPRVSAVAYTRGPGMGGPLRSCAVCARMLSLIWKRPLVPVNHCVAHIEMGRVVTR